MIKFLDGPAAGKADGLLIRRAPVFLRVVRSAAGKWDCLDQLDDAPEPDETVFVYRLASEATQVHLQMAGPGGRGRRCGWYVSAAYSFVEPQPPEEVLWQTKLWQQWATEQLKKEKA